MPKQFVFIGRVQGVGFRYTTMQIAARHAVQGFVRNLPDGSVELVVGGTAEEIRGFIDDVSQSMQRYIRGVDERDAESVELPCGFEIRR